MPWPSTGLYPSEGLFPGAVEVGEFITDMPSFLTLEDRTASAGLEEHGAGIEFEQFTQTMALESSTRSAGLGDHGGGLDLESEDRGLDLDG